MRAADASAGVIKSGGKTRRAAKMVVLNADHPDIVDFIRCKAEEERKAWALIAAGYDASLDGPAYGSIFFQNANNSVRVTDDFMRAALEGRPWSTRYVTNGAVAETRPARDLLRLIAEATWQCGDPGMQFDTTINDWHTCPNTGRINASNPCSEYMHLDDSACNLASLNLMRFVEPDGSFDVAAFRHAVDIVIAAQDIVVDRSSHPTPEIAATAHAYRELGLGYANLGALLMSLGLPYDSDAGRAYAGAVTALMCGEAYRHSAALAAALGPYEGYAKNREPQLGVIEKHRAHAYKLDPALVPLDLLAAAREAWDGAREAARAAGVRNSQLTVLAPTGTIAFMMDCDTNGVEPDIALGKYKKLVGGGVLKLVNNTVPRPLRRVGYEAREIQEIVEAIDEPETIEEAAADRCDDLPVFAGALPQVRRGRARGLRPRRLLRGRRAGRDLHQDGEGGEHDLRPDGHDRRAHLHGAPVRGAARGADLEVRPRALRALGVHQEPGHPDGEVPHRLRLPLPRRALPLRRGAGGGGPGRARGAAPARHGERRPGCRAGGTHPGGAEPDRLHQRDGARHGRPACDHLQPAGGRAELPRLRRAHGAQWHLLQVLQLRSDQRLLLRWGERLAIGRRRTGGDGVGLPGGRVRSARAERGAGRAPRAVVRAPIFPLDRGTTRPIRAATASSRACVSRLRGSHRWRTLSSSPRITCGCASRATALSSASPSTARPSSARSSPSTCPTWVARGRRASRSAGP